MVLLGCIVIAGACFVAYSPAVRGPFLWDDNKYVVNNPLLSAPDGLQRIWFSTDVPSQYFPLVYTTLRFEYHLWRLNPIGYHIDNISLHVISALLLWFILRRLSVPVAFVAAAAFALHPINVESVAWITQRKNTLMLVFALLSVLFYIESVLRSRTASRSALLYVFSLLCFALSLFSKTTACVLPLVLVLILWLKEIPLNKRRFLQVVPYFVLGLAMGLLTMWWEHYRQGVALIDLGLSFLDRMLIATRAIWFYAGKIFWPFNFAFSYPRWEINAADPTQYIWLIACLLAAGGLYLFGKRFGRGPIAAALFFVIVLFPMLGFFQLYTFIYSWTADHYAYPATIGLITLAVGIGGRLLGRLGKNAQIAKVVAAAIILLAMGVLTWRRAALYAAPELIWRDTLAKNPDSWLAHNNLGQVLLLQGNLDEAIFHITRSLELVKETPIFHPHDIAAAHFNLALAYREKKKYEDAIEQLEQTLKIDPGDAEAHYELADLLESQGRLDESAEQFEQTLRIDPNVAMLHNRLAGVLLKQGNVSGAIAHLHRALDIEPDYVSALNALVGIFVTRNDYSIREETKAVEYARRAAEKTNRENPVVLNLLAMAYASDGEFSEAISAAKQALDLAEAMGEEKLAAFIRKQIEGYEKQL
jgi:tetratricopeptide (TPR) repeat protein